MLQYIFYNIQVYFFFSYHNQHNLTKTFRFVMSLLFVLVMSFYYLHMLVFYVVLCDLCIVLCDVLCGLCIVLCDVLYCLCIVLCDVLCGLFVVLCFAPVFLHVGVSILSRTIIYQLNFMAMHTQRRVQPNQCYFIVQITGINFEYSLSVIQQS